MPDVITVGEMLIDFVPTVSGVGLAEAPAFKKAAGGAAANVAVGLSRLGERSGFMGKVGDDAFGHFLARTLRETRVDTAALRFSAASRTTLAFVALRADGEREFVFYRQHTADIMYRPEEVDQDYIRGARALHFGSVSLVGEPARSATLLAVEVATAAGLLVSYDPNLRLNLWPSPAAALEGLRLGWPRAQVIKVSEEELAFLSGLALEELQEQAAAESAARQLWHPKLRLLIVTRGRAGCRYVTNRFAGALPGFAVPTVDTTGAGDGFVAGLLHRLLQDPAADQDEGTLRAACRYANAVGALATTERGAIPALPTAARVAAFLQEQMERE